VISPNSGSGNDKFIIYTNDDLAVINMVSIYDRWGNKVYSSSSVTPNSPDGAWDGRFNGKEVVPGVFVYLIEGILSTGENISLSGDVTVLK
jgi:gliding motility-associated-like protein